MQKCNSLYFWQLLKTQTFEIIWNLLFPGTVLCLKSDFENISNHFRVECFISKIWFVPQIVIREKYGCFIRHLGHFFEPCFEGKEKRGFFCSNLFPLNSRTSIQEQPFRLRFIFRPLKSCLCHFARMSSPFSESCDSLKIKSNRAPTGGRVVRGTINLLGPGMDGQVGQPQRIVNSGRCGLAAHGILALCGEQNVRRCTSVCHV